MGILLVTPLMLALPNLRWSHLRARVPELVALLLLLSVACLTIFGDLPLVAVRLHVLAFAVLPFVIWAAIRFGVSGATLSTLLIATIATVETARSSGPFTQNTPFVNAVLLDVFFAVLSVSGMTLAAVTTEREQAERERERLVRKQAAMEARLRLAAIVESSDDAIIGKDMDGMITDWNKGAERLYGYSAGEVIGKPISLIVPPDRSSDFADIMGTLRRGSSLKHYETVRQKKDGTRIEVSLTVSSIKDPEGQIVGVSVICHDISERKRQEFMLRESEQRLRVAAEVGRMYAWEWDPATDSVVRSAECASILGLSDNAGIAKDYFSFIHPDDQAGLWSHVNSLTPEDPVYRTQYRRFHPGGALLWLEESGCATFDGDGKMVRLVGMTADITERKRAEGALKESEDRYRDLVEHSQDLMCTHDLNGRLLSVNPAVARALGYEIGELLQMSIPDLLAPRDRPLFDAFVSQIRRDGVSAGSMRVITRAGEERIWEYHNTLRTEDVPEPIVRGMARDVTDRKRAQEALHQRDMELAEAQRGVSRRLIEAQEQERTRIARELHDDFGQRLALLTIELELLQQNSSDLPAEVRSRMGELRKRTSEIATDIQSLSHELHSSRLEYVGIAAAMRGFCQEFGEQQKVEIDFRTHDLPSSLPPDISLCLFRVLQEALHNSAKHSGVRYFEVRLSGTSDEVHLTVSDSGAGFDREAAKEARGLGLISMEERLKLLNGTFSIESQHKRGTTIRAHVPLSARSDSMRATG
jgi:PAS domain S-box-containing protein